MSSVLLKAQYMLTVELQTCPQCGIGREPESFVGAGGHYIAKKCADCRAGVSPFKRCPGCTRIVPRDSFRGSYCGDCYKARASKPMTEAEKDRLREYMRRPDVQARKNAERKARRATDPEWRERENAKNAARRQTPAGRAHEAMRRMRDADKIRARQAVAKAIRRGKLTPAAERDCAFCGEPAAQYHHHKGYRPRFALDVVPVCIPCHVEIG